MLTAIMLQTIKQSSDSSAQSRIVLAHICVLTLSTSLLGGLRSTAPSFSVEFPTSTYQSSVANRPTPKHTSLSHLEPSRTIATLQRCQALPPLVRPPFTKPATNEMLRTPRSRPQTATMREKRTHTSPMIPVGLCHSASPPHFADWDFRGRALHCQQASKRGGLHLPVPLKVVICLQRGASRKRAKMARIARKLKC